MNGCIPSTCSFNHLIANHQSNCSLWDPITKMVWNTVSCTRAYHKNGLEYGSTMGPKILDQRIQSIYSGQGQISSPRLKLHDVMRRHKKKYNNNKIKRSLSFFLKTTGKSIPVKPSNFLLNFPLLFTNSITSCLQQAT